MNLLICRREFWGAVTCYCTRQSWPTSRSDQQGWKFILYPYILAGTFSAQSETLSVCVWSSPSINCMQCAACPELPSVRWWTTMPSAPLQACPSSYPTTQNAMASSPCSLTFDCPAPMFVSRAWHHRLCANPPCPFLLLAPSSGSGSRMPPPTFANAPHLTCLLGSFASYVSSTLRLRLDCVIALKSLGYHAMVLNGSIRVSNNTLPGFLSLHLNNTLCKDTTLPSRRTFMTLCSDHHSQACEQSSRNRCLRSTALIVSRSCGKCKGSFHGAVVSSLGLPDGCCTIRDGDAHGSPWFRCCICRSKRSHISSSSRSLLHNSTWTRTWFTSLITIA